MDDQIHDRRRLASDSAGKREMPVLFHLRDVSRPRATTAVASPPAAVPHVEPPQLSDRTEDAAASTVPPPDVARLEQPAEYLLTPVSERPFALAPAVELSSLPVSESVSGPPSDQSFLADAVLEPAEHETQVSKISDAPQPVERPARRFKSPPTEQWFAAHGKFIAAGFVLALLGTIYLARTTRKQAMQDSPTAPSAPLLADTETISPPSISLPKPGELVISSPPAAAPPLEQPGGTSVELQLPVAAQPQTTAVAADKPATGDNLFNFPAVKRAEEQVASRTDIATAPATTSTAPLSPAAATTASLPAAYPVTNSPSLYQEAAPTPPSYPQTHTPAFSPAMPQAGTSAFPPVAAPPLPAAPPAGVHAQTWQAPPGMPPLPGPYQSPETTARGPRYERTGSGNY